MSGPHLNMAVPLVKRLRNRASGSPFRNELWGSYHRQPDKHGVYYVEYRALRLVGRADELERLGHKGWFTDREFQDDVMRGVVCALPARNGARRLVAGYEFTGGDDQGATLFFDTLYDDATEAARMADEHARVAAENECDYQDAERAKLEAEEAEEARLANLAECHPPLHVDGEAKGKFVIFHPVEIAIEYEAASLAEALAMASDFQRDHTVSDMLDREKGIYMLEPKGDIN